MKDSREHHRGKEWCYAHNYITDSSIVEDGIMGYLIEVRLDKITIKITGGAINPLSLDFKTLDEALEFIEFHDMWGMSDDALERIKADLKRHLASASKQVIPETREAIRRNAEEKIAYLNTLLEFSRDELPYTQELPASSEF